MKLAQLASVPLYVVHVMSAGAAAIIQQARADGLRVVGEAVVSGFAASEASVFHPDFEVGGGPGHWPFAILDMSERPRDCFSLYLIMNTPYLSCE